MTTSNGRKSIFVTGAASGIGRATAMLFADKGWFIGAHDLSREGLDSLKSEIGADNGVFETLDVTNTTAFEAALANFGKANDGKLDCMFNNAGIGIGGMLDEISMDVIMAMINVNFIAVVNGCRAAISLLKNTPGSLCLNTSSSSAIVGTPNMAIYSATKHAVRGLTEALSIEFKRYGVRAADLLPGLIDTAMMNDEMRALAPKDGMWRLIEPSEVALAAWTAYNEDRLHSYIPPELRELHVRAVTQPEQVREERTELLMALMNTKTEA
jgi:NAD(P)-dependent dehydrogenase (short-subunit alcohol dehydrogenase family)